MAPPAHKRRQTNPPTSSTKTSKSSHKRQQPSPTSTINQSTHPKPKTSYFSLPAEIRNEITSLALTGDHVYLEAKPQARKLRSDDRKPLNGPSAPGVGLLATCRQAYEEGHVMFYTQNVFHLPVGSFGMLLF